MKRSARQSKTKRRTTLTLPAAALRHAERLARARNVNLSTVVGEALERELRNHISEARAEDILRANREAFSGFTEEQLMVLDGIILEPAQD